MIARVQAKLQDEFLRNNAVFFIGSLLVAALNYLYHPIISRALTVEQFGEVQGYLSIATQLGVVGTVFGMVVLNIKAKSPSDEQSEVIANLYSIGLLVAFVGGALLILGSPFLAQVFSLPYTWGWVLIASAFFVGIPRVFTRFHLQAEKRFALVSLFELLVAAGKIAFALLLFWIGYDVVGAVGGFTLALLGGLLLAYPQARGTVSIRTVRWPSITPVVRAELRYGMLVLVAIGFTTFLYTADILLMRYFFDEETAGLYAGIATVARIIVFATASISAVLLTHVTRDKGATENKQLLIKACAMVLLVGGAGLAIFSTVPDLVVRMLMGGSFLPLAGLLPLLSLAMLLVALVNLLVMYCVALRLFSVIPLLLLSIGTIALATFLWHSAVINVVWAFISGLAVALLLLSWRIFTHDK